MKTILSISGGGMRGVIAARFLLELEMRLGRGVAGVFDLIAGCSTGGILAALLASSRGLDVGRMLEFYFDAGPRIFKRGWFDWGLTGPKYGQEVLQRELMGCIGLDRLGDVRQRVLFPTVDADRVEAVFIKSWDAFWEDFPLWGAAAASASAQTFFPAFSGEYRRRRFRFLDGGNHSNNPAASALYEAWRLWPGEELVVVCLGTGRQVEPDPLPDGGVVRWAPLVFGAVSECQDDCARYFCDHAPGVRAFHFDVGLDRFPAMDDARRGTLEALVVGAERAISREAEEWGRCVEKLKS